MAVHIKMLLDEYLNKAKIECTRISKIESIVYKILNNETTKHIKIKEINKGNVFFISDSSTFIYTFNLEKQKLLEEISKKIPEIKNIKIEIG
ncbi:MAG: hypothetical protein KAJ14_05800 [Candidatus Omnitrophica bacterium]|nr:hypothetical protein [Candidatus Omnitrophota bacterium]MCK5492606.1 hypothetical protein [Candidatus Omnitrophota bacterium]